MVDRYKSAYKKNGSNLINILLVEDNKTEIKIALKAFEKSKLKGNIYTAKDGQEALDFIYHKDKFSDKGKFPTPDLILLDIKMPKVDGFQVLKAIKNDLDYSYIPVIMLTSSKDEEDIARSYKSGAASYIQKPVNYEDFVDIINGFITYWQTISKLPSPEKDKE